MHVIEVCLVIQVRLAHLSIDFGVYYYLLGELGGCDPLLLRLLTPLLLLDQHLCKLRYFRHKQYHQ